MSENRVIRIMFGPKMKCTIYDSVLQSSDLHLFRSPDCLRITTCRNRKMGWQGLWENSNKFVKDSSGRLGKQILGKRKDRWKESI